MRCEVSRQTSFPQRDIVVPHGVTFIKFAGAVGSFLAFATVGVSLLQILHYTSDWTSLRIIWPLTHYGLRVLFVVKEAARMIFLMLALEGQYIPGRLRFFRKQYLPLPYFSGFLGLACQSRASQNQAV